MGNMKFWWIFGFEWWGNLRPAEMHTVRGERYIPLFLGLWLRRPTKRAVDVALPRCQHGIPYDELCEPCGRVPDPSPRN